MIRFEQVFETRVLPDYPIECFAMEDRSPGVFAPAHWHSFSELIAVREGRYEVIVNGTLHSLKTGEALYILPAQIHATICPDIEKAELVVLKFDPKTLASKVCSKAEERLLAPFQEDGFGPAHWFSARETGVAEVFSTLDKILDETENRREGYFYAARCLTCFLAAGLLRQGAPRFEKPKPALTGFDREREAFGKVLLYLNEHFAEEIQIKALLSLCGLCYSNFAAKFKRFTGKNLTDYLTGIRITNASRLLTESGLPIAQIAFECGFSDPCYFDRVFKTRMGISPKGYRELRKRGKK